ncbi:MAG: hypothetical protein ABIH59_01890 [archaeon]
MVGSSESIIEPKKILTPEDCKNFTKFYPGGKLEIVASVDIHPIAMKRFERYSERFISPENYAPGDFYQFFIINAPASEQIHIANQTKTYSSGGSERLVYLHELDESRSELGHGEIRLSLSNKEDSFRDKPFVGYTDTPKDLQGKGRGTNRLLIMNGLTHVMFGLSLHSDQFHNHYEKAAEGAWKRLLRENLVRKYKERESDSWRYCFL